VTSITTEQGQELSAEDMPELVDEVFQSQRQDFQVMNPKEQD